MGEEIYSDDLIGTKWHLISYTEKSKEHDIEFCPNHKLNYSGSTEKVHSWYIQGNSLIISVNDEFATFTGSIKNNVYTGNAQNIKGNKWAFKAELIKDIEAMDELIEEIYDLIKDYRSDENGPGIQMSEERIRRWINQFIETDRVFILTELKNILGKLYCSKEEAKNFLKEALEVMAKEYNYTNVSDFLMETVILDLQRHDKSQPILLAMMRQVLHEEFDFDMNDCGTKQKKNYLYLDDILCTGNTLFQDIKRWVAQKDEDGQPYLNKLQSGNKRLIFAYFFIHNKNYHKKVKQFKYQIADNFSSCYILFRKVDVGMAKSLEMVFPTSENQPESVTQYQQQIEEKVNEYCAGININEPKSEFYRPTNYPTTEEFFTSVANRKRFEDIILQKGISILKASSTTKSNLRALGYSLPSLKNFGFGALCITWRNVPNNCPIVFWYSGGGFFPLFVKHST